jgi:hypothetical protein
MQGREDDDRTQRIVRLTNRRESNHRIDTPIRSIPGGTGMRLAYRSLWLFVVAGFFLGQWPARADITPMDYSPPPTGGGVSPKSAHPTIRLDDQEVIIRLKQSTYIVDAVFHLFNTGETTSERIGFPKRATGRQPGPLGGLLDFIRFQVSVNNQDVPFAEEPDLIRSMKKSVAKLRALCGRPPHPAENSDWLMGQAAFPGHAMTTIRVSYEADYRYSRFDCGGAGYVYGTGRYWKDRIGKASFTIDCTEKGGADLVTVEFFFPDTQSHLIRRKSISENVVRYEIKDFEPDPRGGLSIRFRPRREARHLDR